MDTVVSASGEPLRQNSALDTAAGDISRQNVIRNEHLALRDCDNLPHLLTGMALLTAQVLV